MQLNTKVQKIICGVRNYAWGQIGPDSLVYQYTQKSHLDPSLPYAELWMGSHKSLPSIFTSNQAIPELKYLFKALSIQVHPNKEQAEQLHALDPVHYPDDNHKPEMAISLGEFEALCGLAPKETIINNLMKNPLIIELLGQEIWDQFIQADNISAIVQGVLNFTPQQLIEVCSNLTLPAELQFKDQYPNDVGLVFLLLLNYVKLQEGEALVLEAGSLHAYLKGNCLECMANSDNVVRAGFTDKFKDKDTLSKIMVPKMGQPSRVIPIVEETNASKISKYLTQFDEFLLYKIEHFKGTQTTLKLENDSILIQTKNQAIIDDIKMIEGDTFFIRGDSEITIHSVDSSISYICTSK